MLAPEILPHDASLTSFSNGPKQAISILSFNILLPNSSDGWWIYKMYSPNQPTLATEEETQWEHRAALLKDQISKADADIVCLQEVSPESFESDFTFMAELGYINSEMYKKGRIRPATFWRPDRVSVCGEISHRDRALIIPFKLCRSVSAEMGTCERIIHVVNVHLSAGPEAGRRLRQIVEVCDYLRKLIAKQSGSNIKSNKKTSDKKGNEKLDDSKEMEAAQSYYSSFDSENVIVIMGDMNSDGNVPNVVSQLLEKGEVMPGFLEDKIEVTTKPKKQILGTFYDPYISAYQAIGLPPPPTMVAELLVPRLVACGEEEHGKPHPKFVHTLRKCFEHFASGEGAVVIQKMPLLLRLFQTHEEFMELVLPLRHRVLWPDGPLSKALVEGDESYDWSSLNKSSAGLGDKDTSKVDIERGVNARAPHLPIHLGLYEGFTNSLVGVLSLYNGNTPYEVDGEGTLLFRVQLRKFAVESWCHNKGYGTVLLEQAKRSAYLRCEQLKEYEQSTSLPHDTKHQLESSSFKYILWCDARSHQTSFYRRRGFEVVGIPFKKYGEQYVRMELMMFNSEIETKDSVQLVAQPPTSEERKPISDTGVKGCSGGENTKSSSSSVPNSFTFQGSQLEHDMKLADETYLFTTTSTTATAAAAATTTTTEAETGGLESSITQERSFSYHQVGVTDVVCLSIQGIKQWLLTINKAIGRGSEFRKAKELLRQYQTDSSANEYGIDDNDTTEFGVELPTSGCLNFDDFRTIYHEEVHQGKFWGVAWDMNACGFPLPAQSDSLTTENVFNQTSNDQYCSTILSKDEPEPSLESTRSSINVREEVGKEQEFPSQSNNYEHGRFLARYDRAFVHGARVCKVRATLPHHITPQFAMAHPQLLLLPNALHPSDHLPIGLVIELL